MTDKTCGTCARKTGHYCDVTTWAVDDDDECSVPPEFGGMSWEPRKTCGTCAIGDDSTVWCSERGRRVPAFQEACDEYEERADSVELVALNMLDALRSNCDFVAWRIYRDRLRALGVVG